MGLSGAGGGLGGCGAGDGPGGAGDGLGRVEGTLSEGDIGLDR